LIEFRGVGKTYLSWLGKSVRAVDDVTLDIAPGEVLGIAGPNGAGKSTLISLLLGYLTPTDGRVRIFGKAPRPWIERHGIGYLSELIAIPPVWKTREALVRYATLVGVPANDLAARVDGAMERLGIAEHAGKRVKALSKGNLQRLGLAQSLLRDEQVLILDEPTHGLDPVWTQRFRDIVSGMRRADRIIIIASHNLDELQRLADRVAIIDRGKIQRVVTIGGAAAAGAAVTYRLVVASGEDIVARHFPGTRRVSGNEIDVAAANVATLNRSVAAAIADGAVFTSIAPTHSALEEQFRAAVGAVN
jgi:ABC-type multidrug transport system ATPase subunit